ncbi:LAFA_0D02102g1_1 [Lachancea sp. 'fantastica']|nr:LAFA_0D02102g1_1 [Lachancea sp. 'fantastica']
MLSFSQSPCIYEYQKPAFEAFAPFSMVPGPKRRRVNYQTLCAPDARPAQAPIRWDVTEKENEYVVSFFKRLDGDVLGKAVRRHLQRLREERKPSYHVVRDFFGNEYYVENRFDDEAFVREAMATLDISSIQAQVAKQGFKDFEITLNHSGDKLLVESNRDMFHQEFTLGVEFQDVCINGFEMVNDNVAALRVGVKKPSTRASFPISLRLIGDHAENSESEEDHSEEREDEHAKAEEFRKVMQEAHRLQEREELARQQEAHRLQQKEELARQQEAHRFQQREELALQQEALRLQEAEREMEEKEAARSKAAKAKAAKRIAHRNKKQAILEKKAFLLEQKRKAREAKESKEAEETLASASRTQTPSPSPVVINININAPQEIPTTTGTPVQKTARGRSHSPVLEDVDDEELQRYRQSLHLSPRGSSVVDNV